MSRQAFQRQLAELRDDVVRMADAVLTRFQKAVMALETGDTVLAARINDSDSAINELYLDLEADCIDLFALQQPVASDLRLVAASFKILTDLERIADLAANLAAYVVTADPPLSPAISVSDIADAAGEMVEDAVEAYVNDDTDLCYDVAERDDDLDGRCERAAQHIIRDLVEQSPTTDELEDVLEEVTRLLLVIRDLERIGDHAVNIAARTLYVTESNDALLY